MSTPSAAPLPEPHVEPEPAPEVITPPALPVKRNQHLKIENPKSEQLTGRATREEHARIIRAIQARKKDNEPYDIVRLALDMLNHIENDIFQTFKTK